MTTGQRDAALILAAAFLRSAAVGLVGVILAIHSARIGLSPAAMGAIIGAGLSGGAVATLVVALRGDQLGRRRTLIVLALIGAAGYLALAMSQSLSSRWTSRRGSHM